MTERTDEARRGRRVRLLLLAAIAVILTGTVILYVKIEARKTRQAEVAQRPEARAERALSEADRAVINNQLPEARAAFGEAAGALDEALAAAPSDLKLLRIRASISDRMAYLDQRTGDLAQAVIQCEAAVGFAAKALALDGVDARSRQDRLSTAQRLREVLEKAGRGAEAAPALKAAVAEVEATLKTLPPGHGVRVALADAWLGVAAHSEGAAQVAAYKAALAHAEQALKIADEPISALDHLYGALAQALQVEDHPEHGALLKRAVEVLRLRLALKPQDRTIRRALAARLSQQARAAEGAAALALYDESITLRRALLAEAADNEEARSDLAVALSQRAHHLGRAGEDAESAKLYKEAVAAARPLKATQPALLIKLLGSEAQVLGRMDAMVESKAAAAEAWQIAQEARAAPKTEVSPRIAAVAALRHARLLRAKPSPDRKGALAVAREGLALLGQVKGSTVKLKGAFEQLIAELR